VSVHSRALTSGRGAAGSGVRRARDPNLLQEFDYAFNTYETVTPGPCNPNVTGCCGGSSLTTLVHDPVPYSCYLPWYHNPSEFNVTARPARAPQPRGTCGAAGSHAATMGVALAIPCIGRHRHACAARL